MVGAYFHFSVSPVGLDKNLRFPQKFLLWAGVGAVFFNTLQDYGLVLEGENKSQFTKRRQRAFILQLPKASQKKKKPLFREVSYWAAS